MKKIAQSNIKYLLGLRTFVFSFLVLLTTSVVFTSCASSDKDDEAVNQKAVSSDLEKAKAAKQQVNNAPASAENCSCPQGMAFYRGLCQTPTGHEPCSAESQPVCGCDGKTYTNQCIAGLKSGIKRFTPGACSARTIE